jgi:hypothetical protein
MASSHKDCYTASMFNQFKKPKPQPKPSHPSIEKARMVARLLDTSFTIPFTRKKIGIDPLLGMLPVGGDAVSALLAAYLVWVAIELGLPRNIVIRMSVNILVDFLVGMVPIVGDVADAIWKSNQWNLKLLEEAYEQHGPNLRFKRTHPDAIDVRAERVS